MKKLFAFFAAAAALTALAGLAYYFFKLNPEYNPFCKCDEDFE